jgi:TctA family transporter
MIMSKGSLSIFWSNGLVSTLMAIGLLLLFSPLIGAVVRRLRPSRPSCAAA